MKLRTHFIIAKIAADKSGFSHWERNVFCIGSLIPDLSPMQFIHRHFYGASGEYVKKKLEQLSGRRSVFALLLYGEMAHYVSDFCCSVHADNRVGDVREHILYERRINQYALENREQLTKECEKLDNKQELSKALEDYYESQKYDLHTDMMYAIKASMGVCAVRNTALEKQWTGELAGDML